MNEVVLSLCIPTNGISEWVFPVLDSIYGQANNLQKFEVVVTDNGNNSDFYKGMQEYCARYQNLRYEKTKAQDFTNQIDCFKLATGQLIKFVNHRMPLVKGALEYLISFAEKNQENKPVAYFTNGELLLKNSYKQFQDFDAFMRNLGYWSSWSAGIAIWRSDLEKIDFKKPYSSTFPHTAFLFSNTKAECYIIDDRRLVTEIQSKSIKKGKYNLFTAFSVEYIDILKGLLDDKRISFATFEYIKKDMSYFLSILLYEYIIKKQESSYDLQNYKEAIGKNYSYLAIVCNIPYVLFKNKFLKRIKKCMVSV